MPKDPVVILTREAGDNEELRELLTSQGIEVKEYPCIRTTMTPWHSGEPIGGIPFADFDVVVFTSRRGVAGMKAAFPLPTGSRQLLAVVGTATAKALAEQSGRTADIIAEPSTAKGLAEILVALPDITKDSKILHVRGNKSTGHFKEIITSHGFQLSELTVYRNETPQMTSLTRENQTRGIVVFASPSAAKGFMQYNKPLADSGRLQYLAIGPVTARYLRKQGITGIHEANQPNPRTLTEEVEKIIEITFKEGVRAADRRN